MSDIRFNRWLHQSGTGGIYQDSTGNIGIGTSVPTSALDVVGVITATSFSGDLTGNITGNITGNVTGNVNSSGVSTITTLNATTISGVSTIGVTTATVTTLTVNGNNYPSAGPLSNRNIIINGAMQVAQRGTATSITSDNFGGPDRYKPFIGSAGTWTLSQEVDAPSGTGLYYSYKFQCTSTGTLSAGSYLGHRMLLEGYDSARLNGQQFTISFWVKCNKTGTMTCEPFDGSSGATQSVSKQFTINAADTWEYKTITFPANPHNYPANNAQALILHWWLSAGSNWNSTASTGEWTNFANGFRAYGCNIDLTDSTSNYFQITGIQLEVGEKATPFEHRSYGDELARCQRYYEIIAHWSGSSNYGTIWSKPLNVFTNCWTDVRFKVTKRAPGYAFGLMGTATWTGSTPTPNTEGVDAIVFNAGGYYYLIGGSSSNRDLAYVSSELS